MSWDVYLRPGNGDPDKQEFITHLLQRKHYSGSEAQAFYENADTGLRKRVGPRCGDAG